jgi:hypothetical protein
MIRAMKALVDWLDRRFPPLVTVTQDKFDELEKRLSRAAKDAGSFHDDFMILSERLTAIEQAAAASVEREDDVLSSTLKTISEQERLAARLKAAEDALAGIKDFLSKTGTALAVSQARRDEFVKTGRLGE